MAEACPFHRIHQIDEVGQGLWKKSPIKILGTFCGSSFAFSGGRDRIW